jgi:hypothetical protein
MFYRDLSRRLSDMRSYSVLIGTAKILKKDLSNTIPGPGIEPLMDFLMVRRDKYIDMLMLEEDIMNHISRELDRARRRIHDLSFKHDDFRTFRGGLLRIYKQGKRYRDLAKTAPSFHNLHDLRKRMKYLWYQMIILRPIFPEMLKAYADTLDNIGESLGIYHDFAELQIFLQNHPGILNDRYNAAMSEGCAFKMASILHRTWNAIDSIYSESPHEIAGRFSLYWQAYSKEFRAENTHIA